MIRIDAVVVNSIIKSKEKCLTHHGFVLPAIYPEFVQRNFADTNSINSIVKCNNIDFEGPSTTVKYFVDFSNDVKDSIVNEVGKDYKVKVFYPLDFMNR